MRDKEFPDIKKKKRKNPGNRNRACNRHYHGSQRDGKVKG